MVIEIRYLHSSVPEYLLFFTFDQSLEQLADLVLTHLNTFFFSFYIMCLCCFYIFVYCLLLIYITSYY